jgi:site-specific recombinase XerD
MTSSVTPTSQRTPVDNFVILQPFKSWLINKNYSPATIRNYLSDTNQFFDFANNQDIFSSETVSLYLKNISKDSNYSRYLSSLSKFFQFALDQSLTKTDPLKAALKDKKPNSDEIINQYSEYLNKKHFSESTVKNYINDIKQFIDWSKNQQNPLSFQDISLKKGNQKKLINKLELPFFKGRSSALQNRGVSSES